MRVLFHLIVIVPVAALGFASFLIAITLASVRDAVSVKVPIALNTGEDARRRIRRV